MRQGAWYKFEDDDVTPFDPQEIEACCFGGTTLSTSVSIKMRCVADVDGIGWFGGVYCCGVGACFPCIKWLVCEPIRRRGAVIVLRTRFRYG